MGKKSKRQNCVKTHLLRSIFNSDRQIDIDYHTILEIKENNSKEACDILFKTLLPQIVTDIISVDKHVKTIFEVLSVETKHQFSKGERELINLLDFSNFDATNKILRYLLETILRDAIKKEIRFD